MKLILNISLFAIFFMGSVAAYSQVLGNTDSLRRELLKQKDDTIKVKVLCNLSFSYTAGSYPDTALVYSQQALSLAKQLNYEPGIFLSEITLGEAFAILGNYPLSLEHNLKALALAEKMNDPIKSCYGNGGLAACYYYMGDYESSLRYARKVIEVMDQSHIDDRHWMWIQISRNFNSMGEPDSALLFAKMAYEKIKKVPTIYVHSTLAPVLGNAYAGKSIYDSALLHYQKGISLSGATHTPLHLIDNYFGIAEVYRSQGNMDSALWYSNKILTEKITQTYPAALLRAATMMAEIYESKINADSTLKYLKTAMFIKDSLTSKQKIIAVQNLIFKEQEKQSEIEIIKSQFRNQLKMYGLVITFVALIIIGGIILRNHRQKQLQNIRNSIANDLHDDIGSTLSSISIMSELAKSRSPEASALLASIGESSISVQENMSDIVWSIKAENDHFENILQRMTPFATEILDAKNIRLDFNVDESLSNLKMTMHQRKNFYLFFKEVINNAAKHSGAIAISVQITQNDNYVEMTIKDNGKGFDTSQTLPGNGLASLKKRADELNGSFRLQSYLNEGTIVHLRFRIR